LTFPSVYQNEGCPHLYGAATDVPRWYRIH